MKWKEKRNTCNRLLKDVFFTVQNNQLYKIVRYLYSFRAIFVLFLVKLGNKSEVSLSDPFCQFLDKFTRISINVLASSQISFILSLFRILNEDEKLLFSCRLLYGSLPREEWKKKTRNIKVNIIVPQYQGAHHVLQVFLLEAGEVGG